MEVAPRHKLLTLLSLLTLLTWLTLLTLLSLFKLLKLLYTAKTLACMPIYIVRTLLEWAEELLGKMSDWTGLDGLEWSRVNPFRLL